MGRGNVMAAFGRDGLSYIGFQTGAFGYGFQVQALYGVSVDRGILYFANEITLQRTNC